MHEDGAMSNWVRFLVVDCSGPFYSFKASTLGTARSFQKYYGGQIIELERSQ